MQLVAPDMIKNWIPKDQDFSWGNPISNMDQYAIRHVLCVFDNCDDIQKSISTLYESFDDWLVYFYKLCGLEQSKTVLNHTWPLPKGKAIFQLFITNNEKPEFIKNTKLMGAAYFVALESTISISQLNSIFNNLDKANCLNLEYDLFSSAIDAKANGDYRKAVAEAATALEVCLSKKVCSVFKTTKRSDELKLMKQHKTLGGLFTLLTILKIDLPTDNYQINLIDVRNDVIHRGKYIDRHKAKEFLSEVNEYLMAFS